MEILEEFGFVEKLGVFGVDVFKFDCYFLAAFNVNSMENFSESSTSEFSG